MVVESQKTIHPLKQIKLALSAFWSRFGGKKNWGGRYPEEVKLAALQEMAALKFTFNYRQSVAARRVRFDWVKKRRHNLKSYSSCFVCGAPATCRHHIIEIANGGHSAKRNLVSLCEECHFKVHHPEKSD